MKMYKLEELMMMAEKLYMQHIENRCRERFDEKFRHITFLSDTQKDRLFQICMEPTKRDVKSDFDMMLAELRDSISGISKGSKVISEADALTILISLDYHLYKLVQEAGV